MYAKDCWWTSKSEADLCSPATSLHDVRSAVRLPSPTMSQDDNLIDFGAERARRIHDLNDKRLNEVRKAFEQAMPIGAAKKSKKKPKGKPGKR